MTCLYLKYLLELTFLRLIRQRHDALSIILNGFFLLFLRVTLMYLCFDNDLLQELALYVHKHEESKSRKRGRSHQVHVSIKFKQLALHFHSLYRHHIVNALDHGVQLDSMDRGAF